MTAAGREHGVSEHQFRVVIQAADSRALAQRTMHARNGRWDVARFASSPRRQAARFEAVALSPTDGALTCLVQRRITLPLQRSRAPAARLPRARGPRPAGRYLMVDGPGVECSTHPPDRPATSAKRAYFMMPAHNNIDGVPGRTGRRATYYGAASILRPLSPGTHTLAFVESYTHPTAYLENTDEPTVGRAPGQFRHPAAAAGIAAFGTGCLTRRSPPGGRPTSWLPHFDQRGVCAPPPRVLRSSKAAVVTCSSGVREEDAT